MKLKSTIRIVSLSAALFSPVLVSAAVSIGLGVSFGSGTTVGCMSSICGVGDTIIYIINSILVPVLFAIAFIVFLYGIARAYIFSYGDPAKRAEGHKLLLWGLIAFAVMISVWGLVNVVANTFGLSGYYAPPLPTSY